MYGAGSIGRGFIAQLFSESGYEVVFIDIDKLLIDMLNDFRRYPLRFVKYDESWETEINNVRGVYVQDVGQIADEIASADAMATAVGHV